MNHLVFVYGSLKRGFGNHQQLDTSEYLGNHITDPKWTMVSLGGFPAVVPVGDTEIKGEVYRVDDKTLRGLDYLEGFPRFYQKATIPTKYGEATMYIMEDRRITEDNVVPEGVWTHQTRGY